MRKKYHTLEELRAANAGRAKAWREKNRWEHLQRVKACYGRSTEQKNYEGGVSPKDLERERKRGVRALPVTNAVYLEDMALVEGEPSVVREHARVVSRRTGRGIPAGLMEPGPEKVEEEAPLMAQEGLKLEERGTARERFEALMGRSDLAIKDLGNKGVEVDLEMP